MRLFYAYAPEDLRFLSDIERHLSLMERQGLIQPFGTHDLLAGADRRAVIDSEFEAAEIIVFMVSADFFASTLCADLVRRALIRRSAGQVTVIPVLVRAVDWTVSHFGGLEPLPKNGQPVNSWADKDEAWLDVARGIRALVEYRRASKAAEQAAPDRDDLLRQLTQLLPAQFETLIFRLKIPPAYLSAPSAPQATRAIELLRYCEQPGGSGLRGLLAQLARFGGC